MDSRHDDYRCASCGEVHRGAALELNRWGDPCCPDCGGVDLHRHRGRLAASIAAYFTYSVF
jgi:predicted  nucleic acid-binding Zn-ribbon protein